MHFNHSDIIIVKSFPSVQEIGYVTKTLCNTKLHIYFNQKELNQTFCILWTASQLFWAMYQESLIPISKPTQQWSGILTLKNLPNNWLRRWVLFAGCIWFSLREKHFQSSYKRNITKLSVTAASWYNSAFQQFCL